MHRPFTKENIGSAFRISGIWPINPLWFDERKKTEREFKARSKTIAKEQARKAKELKDDVRRALINNIPLAEWMAMPRRTMMERRDVAKKRTFAKNVGRSLLLVSQR